MIKLILDWKKTSNRFNKYAILKNLNDINGKI